MNLDYRVQLSLLQGYKDEQFFYPFFEIYLGETYIIWRGFKAEENLE